MRTSAFKRPVQAPAGIVHMVQMLILHSRERDTERVVLTQLVVAGKSWRCVVWGAETESRTTSLQSYMYKEVQWILARGEKTVC